MEAHVCGEVHLTFVHQTYNHRQGICAARGMAVEPLAAQNVHMPKKERNLGMTYLPDWRAASGMTLEELAAEIGRSHATVSRIENQKQAYTQETLEAIADVYGCKPGDLLNGPPPDPRSLERANKLRRAMQIFLNLPPKRQDRVVDDVIDAARLEGVLEPDLARLGQGDPIPSKIG